MRKLICFALILCLAVGGIGFAHFAVTAAQDDLVIYPTVQVGDPSVLEGRTASMVFACGDHLRWHTDYPFGGQPQTVFAYSPKTQPLPAYERTNSLDIWFSGGFSSSTSGHFNLNSTEYSKLFQAVADDTPSGGTMSRELVLSEYVEYYLPDLDLNYEDEKHICWETETLHGQITGESWMYEEGGPFYRKLNELFRFPVDPEQTVTIRIDKDDAGRVNSLEMNPGTGPTLEFRCDLNGDGIWFLPIFRDADGNPLPYESPQGHGIYHAPWRDHDNGITRGDKLTYITPDMDKLELVYPMEADLRIYQMDIDSATGNAWLLSREDGQHVLTRCDLTTGTNLARIPLLPASEGDDAAWGEFQTVGEYLLVTADGSLALVDPEAGTLLLTAPDAVDQKSCAAYFNPATGALDFDGERLILTDTLDYWDGGFWTGVWEQGQHLYWGEYDCSLLRGNDPWYYNSITLDQDPMILK